MASHLHDASDYSRVQPCGFAAPCRPRGRTGKILLPREFDCRRGVHPPVAEIGSRPFGGTRMAGAAQAQTTPAAPGFKSTKVGDLEVISLYDGVWEKPHDENFIKGANVEQTKTALKAGGMTDAFVPIPFTVLAVKSSNGVVLLDSGTGAQTGGPKAGLLPQSMAAAGIDPKAVKTIVVSHFHGDHILGLKMKDGTEQVFPNAEIVVPAAELKWWTQPADSIPAPRRGNAQLVQSTIATWKNVKPVDGEADVAPGIRAIPAFGHTQGHTAHLISNAGMARM